MATTDLAGFLRGLTRRMAVAALADLSDCQLVEKVLVEQDETALKAILERHGTMVYRVCWRALQNEHDTEDAFQATFLVLAQKLRLLRKRESLASWLHGVAHRVAQKVKVSAATRRRHESQAPAAGANPADAIAREESLSVLYAELGQLPEKWRTPLILCYLEGKTQDEAARQLGWSKNTLRNRLDEARAALARRLTRRGVVWPVTLSGVLLADCLASAASPVLVARTVEAATAVIAGKTLATATSAKVVALVEGVKRVMLLAKFKIVVVVLSVLGTLGVIGGFLARPLGATLVQADEAGASRRPTIQATPEQPKKPKSEDRTVNVSSDVPGRIADVLSKEEDSVRAGQVLIRLDDRLAKLNLSAAKAKLDSALAEARAAKATLKEAMENAERAKEQFDHKVISNQEYRIAFLTLERFREEAVSKEGVIRVLQVEVEKAELALDQHVVRSPLAGTVGALFFSKGERIDAGQTLVSIRIRRQK